MRKLIDIDKDTKRLLEHKAIEVGKNLKGFIQDELYKLARRKSGKNNPIEF